MQRPPQRCVSTDRCRSLVVTGRSRRPPRPPSSTFAAQPYRAIASTAGTGNPAAANRSRPRSPLRTSVRDPRPSSSRSPDSRSYRAATAPPDTAAPATHRIRVAATAASTSSLKLLAETDSPPHRAVSTRSPLPQSPLQLARSLRPDSPGPARPAPQVACAGLHVELKPRPSPHRPCSARRPSAGPAPAPGSPDKIPLQIAGIDDAQHHVDRRRVTLRAPAAHRPPPSRPATAAPGYTSPADRQIVNACPPCSSAPSFFSTVTPG